MADQDLLVQLRSEKKRLQTHRRALRAEATQIRRGARAASVEAGNRPFLEEALFGRKGAAFDRRQIATRKEEALRPIEDELAEIERQLIEIDRSIAVGRSGASEGSAPGADVGPVTARFSGFVDVTTSQRPSLRNGPIGTAAQVVTGIAMIFGVAMCGECVCSSGDSSQTMTAPTVPSPASAQPATPESPTKTSNRAQENK